MSEATPLPDAEFQRLVRQQYGGDPQAMAALGARLVVGQDAPSAPVDGAALIAEAAQQGDPAAWGYVALLAASGVGRAQSWPDTFEALARAASLGAPNAERELELMRSLGVDSAETALAWIASVEGRELHASPRFVAYAGFLSMEVCEHLLARATPKLAPARVNDMRGGGLKLDPMRTNRAAVFSLIETDVVIQLIRARLARAANVAPSALEPPEVLHYQIGQTYRPHIDFFHPSLPTFREEMRVKGQRIKTCLVYLNEDFEGGETDFPKLGLKFRGRAGEALVFENVGANGAGHMNTLHAGLPPTRGEKWLLSQWIRSKPQRVV